MPRSPDPLPPIVSRYRLACSQIKCYSNNENIDFDRVEANQAQKMPSGPMGEASKVTVYLCAQRLYARLAGEFLNRCKICAAARATDVVIVGNRTGQDRAKAL